MEIHIIRMSSSLCIKCLHRSSSYHWEDEFSSLCNCRQSDQQLIERVQLANVFSRMEEHHLKQNRGRNIFLSVLKRRLSIFLYCVWQEEQDLDACVCSALPGVFVGDTWAIFSSFAPPSVCLLGHSRR